MFYLKSLRSFAFLCFVFSFTFLFGLHLIFDNDFNSMDVDVVLADTGNSTTTASVGNSAPTVSSVSLNGGNTITLIENTATTVLLTGTVTDTNGFDDIASATGTIYRSGATGGYNCTANNNDCYQLTGGSCVLSTGSGNIKYATCTASIYFHADSTSATAPLYSAQYWSGRITAVDDTGDNGSATNSSQTIELNVLEAIDVTNSIAYGASLTAGGNSGDPIDKTVTVTTTGNVSIDVTPTGDGANMCTDYPTCSGSSLAIAYQQYATSSVNFSSALSYNLYTSTSTPLELSSGKPTASPSNATATVYWGIEIPSGQAVGSYTGRNIFTTASE